ncbi:hypothetical protein BZA05DRAFT_91435 [Tricharina praecox]|uniref:uncharacterized protein n=1 Tax=Tricharina praecox TaxID=43433 RepID=UPI00221F72FA|nr:uncharacterized protein BZA05DRAFT_91435 [Tricharina praecox]KAI5848962.1 hypothetical protein BZA05DRAFT_91435 [Tricharina praecox]
MSSPAEPINTSYPLSLPTTPILTPSSSPELSEVPSSSEDAVVISTAATTPEFETANSSAPEISNADQEHIQENVAGETAAESAPALRTEDQENVTAEPAESSLSPTDLEDSTITAPKTSDQEKITAEPVESSPAPQDLDDSTIASAISELEQLDLTGPALAPMLPENTTPELSQSSATVDDLTAKLSCKISVLHLPPLSAPCLTAQKTSIVVTTTPMGTSWTPHPSPPFAPYPANRQHTVFTLPMEDGGEVWVYLAGSEEDDGDEDVPLMERASWNERKEEVPLWEREMVVMRVEARLPVDLDTGEEELAAVERWVKGKWKGKKGKGKGKGKKKWPGEGRFVLTGSEGSGDSGDSGDKAE